MDRLGELLAVLQRMPGAYLLWMAANLGGLLVAYAAGLTIFFFHGTLSGFIPGPEVYLITGTIAMAVAGASYMSAETTPTARLSRTLSLSWPLPVALVYGSLIAMGVKVPVIGDLLLWVFVSVVTAVCLIWASIIWLNE